MFTQQLSSASKNTGNSPSNSSQIYSKPRPVLSNDTHNNLRCVVSLKDRCIMLSGFCVQILHKYSDYSPDLLYTLFGESVASGGLIALSKLSHLSLDPPA